MANRILRTADKAAHRPDGLADGEHLLRAWAGRIIAAELDQAPLPFARRSKVHGVSVPAATYLGITESKFVFVTGNTIVVDLADISRLDVVAHDQLEFDLITTEGQSTIRWEPVASRLSAAFRPVRAAEVVSRIEAQRRTHIVSMTPAALAPHRVNIGAFLSRRGEDAAAAELWQQCLEEGPAEHVAVAALNLARLESERGQNQAAAAHYRLAARGGSAIERAKSRYFLGQLLMDTGDVEGAATEWTAAISDDDGDWAYRASYLLGELHEGTSRPEAAKPAFQFTADSDHAMAGAASVRLGLILKDEGDTVAALAAFQRAVDIGQPANPALTTIYDIAIKLVDEMTAN